VLLNLSKIASFLTSLRICLGYIRRSTPKQRAAHVVLRKALRAAALSHIPASRFLKLFPADSLRDESRIRTRIRSSLSL